MEQAGGPLSGKGNREELVTWVSSVGLSLCVSKMELSGTLGPIPRESVERAGDMGQPWRTWSEEQETWRGNHCRGS